MGNETFTITLTDPNYGTITITYNSSGGYDEFEVGGIDLLKQYAGLGLYEVLDLLFGESGAGSLLAEVQSAVHIVV